MAHTTLDERRPDLLRSVRQELEALARSGRLVTRRRPPIYQRQTAERAPGRRKMPHSPAVPVIVSVGLVLVLAACYFAYHVITTGIRLQNARTTIQRAGDEVDILKTQMNNAHRFRDEKHFARARDAYLAVLSGSEHLLDGLESATRGIKDSATLARAKDVQSSLASLRDEAHRWLETDDIKYRGQGLVLFEGEWMTPEEQERRHEERMRKLGKTFYEGEWRTPEEIAALRGEVYYKGRYMSKAEYEKILEEERQAVAVAPSPTPEPSGTQPAQAARSPRQRREQFEPTETRWLLDDFEQGHDWRSVTWPNANPCQIAVVEGTDGKRLQVTIPDGQQDKCAIVRQLRVDLSSRIAISFDAENRTGSFIPVAVAVITDEYYESRPIMLRPGLTKGITFQLRSGDFKCKATSWTHASRVSRPDSCMWLHILFYHNERGVVLLDNIVAVGG